jgi:transcriptional regulator with XRE-family HTH domain
MEQAGISHAEIARRSGISRDFTNRIARGTRRASDRTAEAALQRLGSEDFAERRVVLKGEPNPIWVAPIRYRDFEKISAWQIAVHQARENADYRSLRHFPRSALEIRIAGSNGQSRRVRLETDPEALRALDDAGELSGGEWRRGPSPSIASSRVAA